MDKIASAIQDLTFQNVALIPVGEEGHTKNGKSLYRTPFVKWTEINYVPSYEQVCKWMAEFDTSTVAMILGTLSGRLVCLDVDTKHYPGIEAKLFRDLREIYPNLWEKFRIEKTPSGGYHILYRVEGTESLHRRPTIASRYLTDEEKAVYVAKDKRPPKKKGFLEIKCEGGLGHCYPSRGYTVYKDGPIRKISWMEHCSILALCGTYDEIDAEETRVKPTAAQNDFYSENPFDHFNNSPEGENVLIDLGWTFHSNRGDYIHYKKPDETKDEVGATWIKSKRIFKVWTTSTDLDDKSYSPSLFLCKQQFNDDRKLLYAHLVSRGFGKIKPKVEKQIVERAAKKGGEIPANVSEEGKALYQEISEKIKKTYPYGIFWKSDDKGVVRISRERVYEVARDLGFRSYRGKPVYINEYKIESLQEREFYDKLKEYIDSEEEIEIFDAYEAFLQNSGQFTIKRLHELDEKMILKSTKYVSYKFYQNCYVIITKDKVELGDYSNLDKLIWDWSIKDRNFEIIEKIKIKESIYFQFLDKAIGYDSYLLKCIGYYAHDYRDENGYFIITTEQCENPKHGGGAGKNIFWEMFKYITTFKSTAASMIKRDNQLLQSWNGERVFCFADMPKGFDLIFFKDIITGNAVVRKLYQDEFSVPIDEMCKLGGSSNYSFDDTDPGIKRRVRLIEFTDFFTKLGDGAVKKYFGKMFPREWDDDDYLGFDNFMVGAIQEFLVGDCVIDHPELTKGGWIKQFEQKYSHLYEFIQEYLEKWIESGNVSNEEYSKDYEHFVRENSIKHKYSSKSHNLALEDYCVHHGIEFAHSVVFKKNTFNVRGKRFGAKKSIKHETESEPF